MIKRVSRLNEQKVRKKYPIESEQTGWYLKVVERSNGNWEVEGIDLWGRRVSRSGDDPEVLLREVEHGISEILGTDG